MTQEEFDEMYSITDDLTLTNKATGKKSKPENVLSPEEQIHDDALAKDWEEA